MPPAGRRIAVRGVVQGVGFRPWVYRLAHEVGVRGSVRNDGLGVLIEAFAAEPVLDEFARRLAAEPPPAAAVREVTSAPLPPAELAGFEIVRAQSGGERRVSIPADLPTCEDCLRELYDPRDRRYHYPFINCTQCGPRFTIARDVPYDRVATTMATFHMCPRCQAEYDDPRSRRFHAQPNACPECGPRLALAGADGQPRAGSDAVAVAAAAIAVGAIVAVKGLGGFHLACDATDESVVAELRRRKRREQKPFAVMVRNRDAAERLAEIDEEERRLLLSPERPVVLLRRRPGADVAAAVAPGNPWLGLFLPYTPLHHLLLAAADRPLVMTSANLSDEPMVTADAEALERLHGIADLFLTHDREIENRCDDSVARVVAGGPVVLRRARGYVPRAVPLARPISRPVLACGAHLKNAICLAAGDTAFFGPHVGDLETLAACDAFADAVEKMERFLGIRPEVIAHDLHPDYFSTRYARRRPEPIKVAVQHHHAHVVAALAEHAADGPALGFAWDGTGYGPDGTAWGGELLLASAAGFERLATLRPLRLAGGETAIREVWRLALAVVDDAFDGQPPLDRLALFEQVDRHRLDVVRRLVDSGFQAPAAHGVGRYFDALGALALARPEARYEGQVALAWNGVADEREAGCYPFEVTAGEDGEPLEVDLRPLVRRLVEELLDGVPPATLSGRFHNTLADVVSRLTEQAAQRLGHLPVVLTGGCFQNSLLVERCSARLAPRFRVLLHHQVPPGDGGLALGQAMVAAAADLEGGLACA
jgi:hydrogenase maturation protein HypF